MRKSKFSESQIVGILKEGEAGLAVVEVCRKHGISAATYYAWKSKYAGSTVSDLTRMRELEAENARLKRMYADLALENAAIKDVLLASAQTTTQQNSTYSNSGFNAGVGLSLGEQTGISVFASAQRGSGNGGSVTHVNTNVTALDIRRSTRHCL